MESIYQKALGPEFARLHPQIQKRFGFSSRDNVAAIGTGIMERIWHGRFYTLPFLYIGAWRRIMFPESAEHAPFTIENYAYCDSFGRETMTWIRTFQTRRTRRFDAYMIYSQARRGIVDYLGSHQHLAVDLQLSVAPNGGLEIRSTAQRLYEGGIGFSFPMIFSGNANVCEWFDDGAQKFCIDVNVWNRVWGPLFGYHGAFEVEWKQVPAGEIPAHIRPVREEKRE